MSRKTKATFVTLGIALGSALLGWLQTEYGVDLGLCPSTVPVYIAPSPSVDGGAP